MLKVGELFNPRNFIVISLFLLSSVPLRMILPNVFLVRFFVLPRQEQSFLFLFKQNEHLHILISQIIDLKLSNINTRSGSIPIQFDIIFIHLLSVDACNVFLFYSFLPPRILLPGLARTNIHIYLSSSRSPN